MAYGQNAPSCDPITDECLDLPSLIIIQNVRMMCMHNEIYRRIYRYYSQQEIVQI